MRSIAQVFASGAVTVTATATPNAQAGLDRTNPFSTKPPACSHKRTSTRWRYAQPY